MPRALWKGAISFGLVYVPVELHTASRENTLPLHMLDSRDFAPVGYQRVNKKTGKEVDWAHIVKGYEYKKGEFVALADSDFKHANVKASETIEIDTFCDVSQIPAMYYEKPYYLAPAKGGDKVYALLRQALDSNGNDVQEYAVLAPVSAGAPPPVNPCPGGGTQMACGSQASQGTTCCGAGLTTCPSSGCDCWAACN